jgi:hypothetical protein
VRGGTDIGRLNIFVGATMRLDMDKGRHPKVVRTWLSGKIRKAASILKRAPVQHKPEPHNKT